MPGTSSPYSTPYPTFSSSAAGTSSPGEPSSCLDDVLGADSDGDGALDLEEYADMVQDWALIGCGGDSKEWGGNDTFLAAMRIYEELAGGSSDPPSIELVRLQDGIPGGLCFLRDALLKGDGRACGVTAGGPDEEIAREELTGEPMVQPDDDGMMGGIGESTVTEPFPPAMAPTTETPMPTNEMMSVLVPPPFAATTQATAAAPDEMDMVACYFDGVLDDVSNADGDGDGVLDAYELAGLLSGWAGCDLADEFVTGIDLAMETDGEGIDITELCSLREFLVGGGGPCAMTQSTLVLSAGTTTAVDGEAVPEFAPSASDVDLPPFPPAVGAMPEKEEEDGDDDEMPGVVGVMPDDDGMATSVPDSVDHSNPGSVPGIGGRDNPGGLRRTSQPVSPSRRLIVLPFLDF